MDLGLSFKDTGAERCGCSDDRPILSEHSEGRLALWRGDLGGDPSHKKSTWVIQSQGGAAD